MNDIAAKLAKVYSDRREYLDPDDHHADPESRYVLRRYVQGIRQSHRTTSLERIMCESKARLLELPHKTVHDCMITPNGWHAYSYSRLPSP